MKTREKSVFTEITVNACLRDVWEAWTTEEGIVSFLAPACDIHMEPGGKYEIYFNPDAPYGEKGGEGLCILALEPCKMLSFTWNAPPSLPEVRRQRTHVVIRFTRISDRETRVSLRHDGWGEGGEWIEAFSYFSHAWPRIVMPRLKYRFDHGPVDWAHPPDLMNPS